MLQNRKILIGVTGSIAAYKIPLLVRLLVREGAEVKVLMTPAARDFVSALTLSTLSRNPVLTGLSEGDAWANHVMLGRWADLMLLAPLSCNTLAKMSQGICDNLLTAVYLSATCPVAVAPAMDEDMWHHPATRQNLRTLESFGHHILPVESGELASGLKGEGRMAEPETIAAWIRNFLASKDALAGKRAMVTAGPTFEAIDPVRFIGNHSSGKMGIALATELASRGAAVTLVTGPVSVPVPAGMDTIRVQSAAEMMDVCTRLFPQMDITVMSAAVADYTPETVAPEKIKKDEGEITLRLRKTGDILKTLGSLKKPGQLLVGFALETTREREYALRKLSEKNADLLVLNSLRDAGAGFGHDTNRVTVFDRHGNEEQFELKSKAAVAADIVNAIIRYQL